jgi:hypothetical protein
VKVQCGWCCTTRSSEWQQVRQPRAVFAGSNANKLNRLGAGFCCIVSDPALWSACVRLHRSLRASGRRAACWPSLRVKVRCGWCGTTRSSDWQQARQPRAVFAGSNANKLNSLGLLAWHWLAYIVLCMRVKPFCVCGMATWLDVANRQGVLGGSWTRLGSEARSTMDESEMPCPLCGDWLEGGQRSAAASFGRQTRERCDLKLNRWADSLLFVT